MYIYIYIYFPNRSLLLRVLMGHQRAVTETHTKREATSIASRPRIAKPIPTKHHFVYKTNGFLNDFELFLQYGPSGNHIFVSRVRALITKHINFQCNINILHQFIKKHQVL